MPATQEWQVIASQHREKQKKAIPPEWLLPSAKLEELRGAGTPQEGRLISLGAAEKSNLLTDKEFKITESYTAKQILSEIHGGRLTSAEVTVAYCKRAALAHQLTNCLTEIFFQEGIGRARELDQHLKNTGKPVGPLHGLPISLKDSYKVKGHYASVGFVEFLKRPPPDSNAALVDLLLDAGAVLYCKTNVPQTMMTADSENNVFGRTLNPHKTTLTAGGSTGGEGALVSFRGSVLGVGSDIAGSVRIPPLCCGVYSFKPTADRVPFGGQAHHPFPKPRIPGITPVSGPMANSVDDLSLFMETVLAQRPWKYDANAIDIPWRGAQQTKSLTIGVLPEDPEFPLHPPVRHTIEKAASALLAAGHKIVRLPFDSACSAGLGGTIGFHYFGLTMNDLDTLEKEIGEPLIKSVVRNVHPFTDKNPPFPPDMDVVHKLSEFLGLRETYADNWRKTWLEHELDVVIGPGAASTAVPHDTYGNPAYTLMWNVLDYPAGIIPYGFSSKQEFPESQKNCAGEFEQDYDPDATDGAPCVIQVSAPRFRDEECLEAMRIIDRDIRKTATNGKSTH